MFCDNNDDFSPAAPVASRPPSFRKGGFVSGSETILSFLLARRPQKQERLSPGVWGLAGQGCVLFIIISEGRRTVGCTNIHMTWTGQSPS